MACIIYDYCDSATLFTLSMTCSKIKNNLLSESTQDRAIKKGYLVRILKFKYDAAAARLKNI